MGTPYMNFKNFTDKSPPDDGTSGNYPLVRQSSVYSLTFEEFQNTMGGSVNDFGSMNMEEFLRSVWNAEENQAVASSSGGVSGAVQNGNLQRQSSLTLPRTLSQKTVDEVWREVLKETIAERDGTEIGLSFCREPTLGEMRLEDFLAKAGVVREDVQLSGDSNITGFYANSFGLRLGFQQPNQFSDQSSISFDTPKLGNALSGHQQSHQPLPRVQPLLPKQVNLDFSFPSNITSNAIQSSSPTKELIVRMPNSVNGGTIQRGDAKAKYYAESPTVSLSPYQFEESRRSTASLEKVVERRKRRMIMNRSQLHVLVLESRLILLNLKQK